MIRDAALSLSQRRVCASAALGPLLRRAGGELGVAPRATFVVRLTDDATVRELNARFLDDDHATDVLAFPGGGATLSPAAHMGDVAISIERAMAQSDDGAAELRLLAVHGLLHCLGYDHADRQDAARMTQLTRDMLPEQTIPDL